MKMCERHWSALRAAIDARGMGHLVAANGRDAFARTVAELQGNAEADDFDPLMGAHNMIWSRALSELGLYVMRPAEEGGEQPCPACDLIANYPEPEPGHKYPTNQSYFIDGPADAALHEATARGLMNADLPSALSEG